VAGQLLDGDVPVELAMSRPPDHAELAPAQLRAGLVVGERLTERLALGGGPDPVFPHGPGG
jgi:hypothetical protein